MTSQELATLLREIGRMSSVANQATAIVVDPASEAGRRIGALEAILQPLYGLAADIAEAGQDPAAVIARIADAKPWLADTEAEWAARLAGKFPGA